MYMYLLGLYVLALGTLYALALGFARFDAMCGVRRGPSSSGASEPEIRRRIRSLCADDDDLPGASRPSEITSS